MEFLLRRKNLEVLLGRKTLKVGAKFSAKIRPKVVEVPKRCGAIEVGHIV